MHRSNVRIRRPLVLLALWLAAGPAWAFVSVGNPPCAVRSIQQAIDVVLDAQRNGGATDPFIVVAAGSYAEELVIDGSGVPGAVVFITGGFDQRCVGPAAGSVTTIDASGRSASAVTIRGTVAVTLNSLVITGGDDRDENGGGIDFRGAGSLDTTNVRIAANRARFGAGIHANAPDARLDVTLHRATAIADNHAERAGGGIRIDGNTRLVMREADSSITGNSVNADASADGTGGGLQAVGESRAELGSILISRNSARHGGGIASNNVRNIGAIFVRASTGEPPRIQFNTASHTGGGIYVQGNEEFFGGFVSCTDCRITGNAAQQGAAIYADASGLWGGRVELRDCSITRNFSMDGNTPAPGATLLVQTHGQLLMERCEVRGNAGGQVYRAFDTLFTPSIINSLIAENVASGDLFVTHDGGRLAMRNSTIANNTIGGSHVFSLDHDLTLTESLVWQPGRTTLEQAAGRLRDIRNVMASEIFSFGNSGPGVLAGFPQFVSLAAGDYHLQPTSPALDFAPALDGDDLDGRTRTFELPQPNRPGGGALDLGAYELQGLATFPPAETFDEATVNVPSLPLGWSTTHSGAGIAWVTVATNANSLPNTAFTDTPASVSDKSLVTPAFDVAAFAQLTFLHRARFEHTRDGAVLEISINGGAFADIITAGGHFVGDGGYGHTLINADNPLVSRQAWSGDIVGPFHGGFRHVIVDLPPSANGQSVRLRWRVATDASVGGGAYWLDNVFIDLERDEAEFNPILRNGFEI